MSDVRLTNVFHRTGEAFLNAINGTGPRLIINQGGQGSSKTYSILQVIYNALRNGPPMKTTFCSYALPHLKQGVVTDFDNILNSFGENIGLVKSSPGQPIYKIGKSEINCYGVEGNLAMAHGPRRHILFINEANRKISYDVFDQLFSRSQITFLDYNPDQEFWLHEKVIPNFPHILIKSNFLDNPYLPENELQNILMKKGKPGFENWWKVYGLGELGKFEGAIFTNWRYGEFDDSLPYSFGLDFGFNHPDALVKTAIDHKHRKMYWDEKIYKSGNSQDDLLKQVRIHTTNKDLIVADSAEPRLITHLKTFLNIVGIDKKICTVAEAIKMMQGYEHILTDTSFNLGREFSNYLWSDKKAGIPIDAYNHLIDGGRYTYMQTITPTPEYFVSEPAKTDPFLDDDE